MTTTVNKIAGINIAVSFVMKTTRHYMIISQKALTYFSLALIFCLNWNSGFGQTLFSQDFSSATTVTGVTSCTTTIGVLGGYIQPSPDASHVTSVCGDNLGSVFETTAVASGALTFTTTSNSHGGAWGTFTRTASIGSPNAAMVRFSFNKTSGT